ncbi:CUB and sushi domain-containing protein 1-like [Daphnia pulex]|uniref:CUB and sushi domain-containing protein 1-like n=1 Tax=Daphnia pulex TaxID=6669 RepID=UPI001EDDF53F|nr:CUB and sushi domain-containing protein 1-like [Daphnia pulex]
MHYHLIALVLIASTAVLVEIKCQTTNISTTLLDETSSTLGTSDGKLGEVHCSAPGPFPNGWIDATQNLPLGMSKVGRAIVYRCNRNMKQIGASEAVCEISGRWSKNPPQCLASCIVPLVDHGVIRDALNGSIISHGENVILECNQSYQPAHGLSKYICNNGTLNVTPRCDPGESPKGNCNRPDILDGTFVQIDGKNVTRNQTYDIGTEIIYRCQNPGHQMIDTGLENSTRICNATTKNWTGTPPNCVATCRSLIPQSNHSDNDLHLRFNVAYDETALSGGRYKIGTKAIMRCNFGERVIHPSTDAAQPNNNDTVVVVCQSNGTWRGFVPLCDPPPNDLDLSQFAIIVACVVSILIFALAVVLLCESRSRQARRNRVVENTFNRTDSQRMRAELLRQTRRKTFYALEDRPDGEREYATIHRVGQSPRPSRLAVEYSKL